MGGGGIITYPDVIDRHRDKVVLEQSPDSDRLGHEGEEQAHEGIDADEVDHELLAHGRRKVGLHPLPRRGQEPEGAAREATARLLVVRLLPRVEGRPERHHAQHADELVQELRAHELLVAAVRGHDREAHGGRADHQPAERHQEPRRVDERHVAAHEHRKRHGERAERLAVRRPKELQAKRHNSTNQQAPAHRGRISAGKKGSATAATLERRAVEKVRARACAWYLLRQLAHNLAEIIGRFKFGLHGSREDRSSVRETSRRHVK